ncbi:hypothetical protein D3C75_1306860 [compost metagenome]
MYLENSQTPIIIGHMFIMFFPKKENPVVSHKDIIVDPFGFMPMRIRRITIDNPVRPIFIKVAPMPPMAK